MSSLLIENRDGICSVTLNRPDVRNAFDDALIAEITEAFRGVDARAVVLSGNGKAFCAGGDLEWMRRSVDLSKEENLRDAEKLQAMFEVIDSCPCPVIGKIHGAAFGGGAGLVSVCDMVVAAEGTKFCFSEVKLGLAPAVIAPYAIRKIGPGNARRYFLTAEVMDAQQAQQVGLVNEVTLHDHLDDAVQSLLDALKLAGPNAVRRAKALIREISSGSVDVQKRCAETIAELRVSDEGQEGVRAFLEKRTPNWAG